MQDQDSDPVSLSAACDRSDPGDTIVAISTPPGRGGIGIVRLSGPAARQIASPMLRLRRPLAPGQVRFAEILDLPASTQEPSQALGVSPPVLDQAIVTFYAAPHSYTTEDVVEIACHGAPVLLDYLVRACLQLGARLAEPGEFTQRAFLAGRLDLAQAEAVHDLIASSTLHQARVSAAQLGGSLSRAIAPTKHELIQLIAALEAGIDFAEDDIDLLPSAEIEQRLEALLQPLAELARSYSYGRVVREGFTLAIVGRPNAGKSSLFNRLLARDRAIVTDQPGTTRDTIVELVAIAGIPVQLIDTAGLRLAPEGPQGEAERSGMAKTVSAIAEADLILHVLDASTLDVCTLPPGTETLPSGQQSPPPEVSEAEAETQESASPAEDSLVASLHGRPHLIVVSKADLLLASSPPPPLPHGALLTSARTGEGIEPLRQAIVARLTGGTPDRESALLTNLRQQQAILLSAESLRAAQTALANRLPHELILLDLYAALHALDQLTGATTPQDVLHLIFSSFCIGK